MSPLSQDTFAELCRADTSAVANAIESFKVQLRNEGYLASDVKCRTAPNRPMLGYAITIEMRSDLPPTTGSAYIERNDWWETIAAVPRPKVVVISDVGEERGAGAVAGEVHASIYQALGAIGIVTDGAVRDLRALAGLNMHVFSRSTSPSHAYAHIVSVGTPVEIGGMRIESGDLLHGDRDGIIKIPLAIAEEIPQAIARMRGDEERILEFCRSPDFSAAGLRRLLQTISGAV